MSSIFSPVLSNGVNFVGTELIPSFRAASNLLFPPITQFIPLTVVYSNGSLIPCVLILDIKPLNSLLLKVLRCQSCNSLVGVNTTFSFDQSLYQPLQHHQLLLMHEQPFLILTHFHQQPSMVFQLQLRQYL